MAEKTGGNSMIEPQMSQSCRRQDKNPCPAKPCGKTANHNGPQRNAMNDIGAFGSYNFEQLNEIAQDRHRAETAAFALHRNHGKSFGLQPFAVLAHARCDGDLISTLPRRLRHRQEMRYKE